MSTHEEVSIRRDPRVPNGYTVTYHENRGYDSPDRWFEAHYGNKKLGDFGSFEQALAACTTRAERKPGRVGSIKTLGSLKLRLFRSADRVTLHYGDTFIPLSYEGVEELRNLLEKADSEP